MTALPLSFFDSVFGGYDVLYQRWKSQRSLINRLAYRFSIDFLILVLAYRFLSKSPRFLFANDLHLTKGSEF
jgi:hypothetical protein